MLLCVFTYTQFIGIADISSRTRESCEFDTVGVVVSVSSRAPTTCCVFLADARGSLLQIRVWSQSKVSTVKVNP